MITEILKNLADRVFRFLDNFSRKKFWQIKTVIIISVITLIYSFQNYPFMVHKKIMDQKIADSAIRQNTSGNIGLDKTGKFMPTLHEFVQRQIENPLLLVKSDDKSWRFSKVDEGNIANRQFRLFMPLLGNLLHLNVNGLILIQFFSGFLLLALVLILGTKITDDKVFGILLAMATGFCFLGKACFIDIRPYFDGIAYTLLLISMVSKRPWIIVTALVCAFFTDERAVIASILVYTWWQIFGNDKVSSDFAKIFKPISQGFAVIVSWIIYISIRFVLIQRFEFTTHLPDLSHNNTDLISNYKIMARGLLSGLKWLWIPVVLVFVLLFTQKRYFVFFAYALPVLLVILPAFVVHDITKTTTYAFPALFFAIKLFIKEEESTLDLRYIILSICVLNFFMAIAIIPLA